jgi:O-antigen ligase
MERAATLDATTRTLGARWSLDRGSVAAWLLPAALVSYLGIRSGGYDTLISDQVAIALWWVVFLVLVARVAPLRLSPAGRVGFGLLAAYAAWTAASLIWTESAERTMGDVTLLLLYVALALLLLWLRGREAARLMLGGLAVAIVAVATVALLSRLHFAWFSLPEVAKTLPASRSKLSYPLGYWNALAALMEIAVPILLYHASGARSLILRAASAGAIPVVLLCVFLTDSRGGPVAVGLGVLAFLVLAPDRLPKLAVAAVVAAGSALAIGAANQRPEVRDGMRTALAARQGNQLIVVMIVIAVGVGLLVWALALLERHVQRPPRMVLTRAATTRTAAIGLLVALAVFLAAGGPGFLQREWNQFKTPGTSSTAFGGNGFQRLSNISGNGRYQYWQSAIRAADRHPWTGTGAGTFVYWWSRNGTRAGGFVQDAHSLYLQSLAELGYPGLVLISLFVLWILFWGVRGAITVADDEHRLAIAAATAGAAAFAFAAAVDWIWLIPVLPATLLILAAVIFYPRTPERQALQHPPQRREALRRLTRSSWARVAARAATALAALAAVVVIALPMAATAAVRQSQSDANAGDLSAALASARTAVRLQPYAAAPWLQEALVLELAGDLRGALVDAQHATARESTNWQTWLVLSRLQARTGHAGAALADYLKARSLAPYNPLFDR